MSFSFDTKNELCKLPVQRICCARAEAYGILLYCNTFHSAEIRIITENPNFAARLPKLFHRAFNLQFDRRPELDQIRLSGGDPHQEAKGEDRKRASTAVGQERGMGGKDGLAGDVAAQSGKLVFQITEPQKLAHIINLFGYSPRQNPVLHINFGLLEEECCRAAFLRGVFFAGGSMTDPLKRYHLELTTSHLQVSRELEVLLRENGFPPKSIARNGSFVTYFKQSDQIEDFLTLIGAPVAAMNIMSAKLEKDLRNSVNRRLNCDSANLDKAVEAAQEQLEAIRKLMGAGLLEQLPDKLQLTAALRLENPELTLSELAGEFDPPVTKSCLNHRLRKIMELAKTL